MNKILGIKASSGIGIAKVFKLENQEFDIIQRNIDDIDNEVNKLDDAIQKSKDELEQIKQLSIKKMGEDSARVFDAYVTVLDDPEMFGQAREKIVNDRVNAEFAVNEACNTFIEMLESMDDEYLRERASDIKDVRKRVFSHLFNKPMADLISINEKVIIVAKDLTPSDTAQLDHNFVCGFVSDIGGSTSHSAIMARNLEIPAVVGTQNVMKEVNHGDLIIIDGFKGEVIINPNKDDVNKYKIKLNEYIEQKLVWKELKDKSSLTSDGYSVELGANIGTPNDVNAVIENGGEGVGLYRTEFLYMDNSDFPTEEMQYQAYKNVLERLNGKSVVIRTLDIGGDKKLSYFDMPEEMNPFLGYRAIRMCLKQKDIFKTQLRALLRASVHGNLKIMFPMIATIGELKDTKKFFFEVKRELIKEGYKVSDAIEIGIMIEIPAAAIIADKLAKLVDFFSIGTNDLIQYTLAADRMNERVSYLYQPYNPSILRLVKYVIDSAHAEGKWVGMCGAMAGDMSAIPILIGLGLDEFSMSASNILQARDLISKLNKRDMEILAQKAIDCMSAEEVLYLVEDKVNCSAMKGVELPLKNF